MEEENFSMKVLLINGSPNEHGCTFTIKNMPIVSSQYWNQVHGFTPDDVRKDIEGMQTIVRLLSTLRREVRSSKFYKFRRFNHA